MYRFCLAALAAALATGSAAAQTTTTTTGTTKPATGTTSGSTTDPTASLALVQAELDEMNGFITDFVELLGVEVTTPQEARMVIAFAAEVYLVAKMQPGMRAAAGYGRAASGYGGGGGSGRSSLPAYGSGGFSGSGTAATGKSSRR